MFPPIYIKNETICRYLVELERFILGSRLQFLRKEMEREGREKIFRACHNRL